MKLEDNSCLIILLNSAYKAHMFLSCENLLFEIPNFRIGAGWMLNSQQTRFCNNSMLNSCFFKVIYDKSRER